MSDLGAVIYVVDIGRTSAFYRATTGWTLTDQDVGFARLQSPSRVAPTSLTLVRIPEEYAVGIVIAEPPVRREDTPIKLSFAVTSLEAARLVASTVGGRVDPVEAEWTFGSVRVCDGHDPEGNVIQFRQDV